MGFKDFKMATILEIFEIKTEVFFVSKCCCQVPPYTTNILCPENVVCSLHLLHIFKCTRENAV